MALAIVGRLEEMAVEPRSEVAVAGPRVRARRSWRARVDGVVATIGAPFFFVAAFFTYYGQLNRDQTSDTYGTIYTAVAIVQKHTIWLDSYLPYIQRHAGKYPYMLAHGPGGHIVNATPSAGSILALPVVALFSLVGVKPQDWSAWMEADMLTASITAAATVATMYVLLTRLTTRRRAAVLTAVFAWGTLEWGIGGQSLWQHTGACLALVAALLALVDRRLVLAGVAVAVMVAFRPSTPVIVPFLLPLLGRRARDWGRFVLGILPFVLPLLAYNFVAFGSPFHQGYGTGKIESFLFLQSGRFLHGAPALLFSPGIGVLFYSPVVLLAIVGAVKGWRVPLYRWCALAAAAYIVVASNDVEWWGGESFGPRKLMEAFPLLVLLLVPALDALRRTRWLWAFVALFAYSVFVELLGAAANPPSVWFDRNLPLDVYSTWWSPTNNQLVAMLGTQDAGLRLAAMAILLLLALGFGVLAERVVAAVRQPAPT